MTLCYKAIKLTEPITVFLQMISLSAGTSSQPEGGVTLHKRPGSQIVMEQVFRSFA